MRDAKHVTLVAAEIATVRRALRETPDGRATRTRHAPFTAGVTRAERVFIRPARVRPVTTTDTAPVHPAGTIPVARTEARDDDKLSASADTSAVGS